MKNPAREEYELLNEDELIKRETEYIRKIRIPNSGSEQPAGFAISGGGIRSASFGLGALQALSNLKLIEKLDYLSTVSGGGYIGSCLSWFLNKDYHQPDKSCSLGKKDRKGIHNKDTAEVGKTKLYDVLDYLRVHGKYLTPGKGIDLVSALGVVLRSMFLGILAYFPLLVATFYLIHALCGESGSLFFLAQSLADYTETRQDACFAGLFIYSAFLLLVSMVLVAIIYSVFTCISDNKIPKFYWFRIKVQELNGGALKLLIALVVVGTLPMVIKLIGKEMAALLAGSSSLFGYLVGIIKFTRDTCRVMEKKTTKSGNLVPVAALLLIYGLLLGGYLVAGLDTIHRLYPVLIISVITAIFVNLNYVSLHRMYRDRLMEMFLPDLQAVRECKWMPAGEANGKELHSFKISDEMAEKKKFDGPFHIINTNLIQVDASDAKFRGRCGDSFILTPLFCGSSATGWCTTDDFNGGTMTLATAMAVSGAAVSPHAGVSGQGATTNKFVSFLMSFFNISLGYWARNPRRGRVGKCGKPKYLSPGFWKGLMGMGYTENSKFIELSDGGHFENLAVYELIRRRVKTIIVTDGGADLDFNFSDLANLVEKVRVDFGVEIDFSESTAPICDLLPGSGCEKSLYKNKYNLAKRGYARGKIKYPIRGDEKALVGHIYYIKSTLTGNLPEDIYGYKSNFPDFPDQSTTDQFFDEVQFEVYRELGYQLTKAMLKETGVLQGAAGTGTKDCEDNKKRSADENLSAK